MGSWSLQAEAVWPNGQARRVNANGTLLFRPAFAGTDGRKYVLKLTSTPEKLLVNNDAIVHISLVDADDQTLLPDTVNLVNGLPAALEVGCYGAGVTSRLFEPIRHGEYAGTIQLWVGGAWRVWADVPEQAGSVGRFFVGTLDVADAPKPKT
jgi:hypothetical protein